MNLASIITLLGGLAFFLFGMSLMGDSLKKVAGGKLETTLGRLTSTPLKGVLLGAFVTAVIQSSSATTVMVVGFVNSGLMTLRQAINRLVFEGLLIRKKGYGTTVAPQNVMSNARNWMSFSQEMHAQGMVVQNFELHISRKHPSQEAAAFLNAPEGTKLLCLERLRGRPGLPFVYFISYFNPAIPMTGEEDMAMPLYENLQKNYGIVVKTSREQIYARAASPDLADKLDISEGAPILVRKRFVLDVNDKPVEYNIGYYRADSFTYSIEFTND